MGTVAIELETRRSGFQTDSSRSFRRGMRADMTPRRETCPRAFEGPALVSPSCRATGEVAPR
jgi:hypothetical protein